MGSFHAELSFFLADVLLPTRRRSPDARLPPGDGRSASSSSLPLAPSLSLAALAWPTRLQPCPRRLPFTRADGSVARLMVTSLLGGGVRRCRSAAPVASVARFRHVAWSPASPRTVVNSLDLPSHSSDSPVLDGSEGGIDYRSIDRQDFQTCQSAASRRRRALPAHRASHILSAALGFWVRLPDEGSSWLTGCCLPLVCDPLLSNS